MEWNGGVDYWSGVLDWITGVTRLQIPNLLNLLSAMSQNLFTTLSRLAKEFKPSLGLYPTSSHAIPEAAGLARLRESMIVSAVRLRGMEVVLF